MAWERQEAANLAAVTKTAATLVGHPTFQTNMVVTGVVAVAASVVVVVAVAVVVVNGVAATAASIAATLVAMAAAASRGTRTVCWT